MDGSYQQISFYPSYLLQVITQVLPDVTGNHSSARGTGGLRNQRHTRRWHYDSATEKER